MKRYTLILTLTLLPLSARAEPETIDIMPDASGMNAPGGDRMNPAASAPGSQGRLDGRAAAGTDDRSNSNQTPAATAAPEPTMGFKEIGPPD